MGLGKTLAQLQKRACWPGFREDVRMQLRKCMKCSQYIRGKPPKQGRLQAMSLGALMECLGVDITGPHPPSSRGYRFILTAVDHFTRWAEAHLIRNQEAATVAKVLV